jgi:hypothetical protein
MSIKLTETQLLMLSAAAQRTDRYLVPAPNLKVPAAQKIASKLIGAGLVREIRARAGAPVWRRDDDAGLSYALRLTAAGANAIAIKVDSEPEHVGDDGDTLENVALARSASEELSASPPSSAGENGTAPRRSFSPRGETKLAQVVELLQQDRGASIAELIVVTAGSTHDTCSADWAAQARLLDGNRSVGQRARFDLPRRKEFRRRSQRSRPLGRTAVRRRVALKDNALRGETQSASSGVMAMRRPSGDAGATSPLSTPRSDNAGSVEDVIAGLADLDAKGLRLHWRNHLGGTPPAHLPRWLLLRVLAYQLQVAAFGGLDKARLRVLQQPKGRTHGSAGSGPFETRIASTREGADLRAGALLVREWKGKLERVTVLEKGFAWNGKSYSSLSQIAKAMTGTAWNGRRFFGLRMVTSGRAAQARPDTARRRRLGPMSRQRGLKQATRLVIVACYPATRSHWQ